MKNKRKAEKRENRVLDRKMRILKNVNGLERVEKKLTRRESREKVCSSVKY